MVLLRGQHAEDTASFSLPAPSDDPLAAQDRPRQQLSALLAPGASGGKKKKSRQISPASHSLQLPSTEKVHTVYNHHQMQEQFESW